jgi:fatty acyl-CoA reductase
VKRTDEILDLYPNTYTFTKSLCERLLQKHRGSLPLCIVRPAVINASYREPFEGWVDTPSAASALYLYGGLGLVQEIFGNPNYIGDNIPCDVVVDFMIVATAYHANKN